MKYAGMPMAMWIIFSKSFKRNLTDVLKYDEQESRRITAEAKKKYRAVIEKLPEFEYSKLCNAVCIFPEHAQAS